MLRIIVQRMFSRVRDCSHLGPAETGHGNDFRASEFNPSGELANPLEY
jgi:hypothetical protein